MDRQIIEQIITVESLPRELTKDQKETLIQYIETKGIEKYFNSNLRGIIKNGGFELIADELKA